MPLYVKSAEILIDDWLTHSFPNKLPPGSILFIYMHFISMYSNIDTEYGIQVVRDYILPKISRRYPKWLPHWSLTSQQKKSCSLVLKVKKRAALFFQVLTGIYNTGYGESSALLKKCTRYFFQRDTSSESNCNRSFRGQPSGWNRLIVVMCTSTRVLP